MGFLKSSWSIIAITLIIIIVIFKTVFNDVPDQPSVKASHRPFEVNADWQPPNENSIHSSSKMKMILYGRELIVHTSRYLGQKGSVAAISNGMNCQNCHLQAGTQAFANPFSSVASTYPKYRDRSGKIENVRWRINECMQRSLNGKPLDSNSREMNAMISYLMWIGSEVPRNMKPKGTGTEQIPYLKRAADPYKGRIVFINQCQKCHGNNGQGLMAPDSSGYIYPPLWGNNSYNVSAGIFQLSKLAGFIKNNMPYGASWKTPMLTAEQSWDVAAFINSQPRPQKFFRYDWPDITKKPIDYPFGPYADLFSEKEHKYGPFEPMKKKKDKS